MTPKPAEPNTWMLRDVHPCPEKCEQGFVLVDGWQRADPAVVAAMRHLIDAWSEFAAVPGPWAELETVRAWLGAADAGGGDGN